MANQLESGKCTICLENSTNTIRCGHFFHPECLKGWEEYNSCPVCRAPIDGERPIKKFKANTEDDEDFATRLLFEDVIRTTLRDSIYSDSTGMNPFGVSPFVNGLLSLIETSEQFFQAEVRQQREMSAQVLCAECGVILHMDEEAIHCPHCGELFYCSLECVEDHEYECPNFTCADCDEQPCVCEELTLEENNDVSDHIAI
jgi:hypothetical protein